MPTIHLTTFIAAPVERVFDLNRSIGLQKVFMERLGFTAVAGITAGLINKEESVTWKGKYLYKTRFFTSRVTDITPFELFIEKMIRGDFKNYRHEHYFKPAENGTIVIDIINFEISSGWLGRMITRLYLHRYIESMIMLRNETVRQYAVSDKWMALLNHW